MKSFEYATPNTVEEACTLLSDTWGETEVLAGGTDLITCMKQGLTSPKRVVSLKNIAELKEIKMDELRSIITVGSMVTLAQCLQQGGSFGMQQVIKNIGARQMIAQGTIGGELLQRPRCWYFRNGYGLLNKDLVVKGDNRYHAIFGNQGSAAYVHPSSLAPALMCCNKVSVHIAGPGGTTREVGVSELFQTPAEEGQREHTLKPNEIITGFSCHLAPGDPRNSTYEIRHRHGLDWPYVTATVTFQTPRGAKGARVVLGHVAPVPWVCEEAGKILDEGLDEANVSKAAEAAVAEATPLSGNAYKVAMVKTAIKRAVKTLVEDIENAKQQEN